MVRRSASVPCAQLLSIAEEEQEVTVDIEARGERANRVERRRQRVAAELLKADGFGARISGGHRNLREGELKIVDREVLKRQAGRVGTGDGRNITVREIQIGVLQIDCDAVDLIKVDVLVCAVLAEEVVFAAVGGDERYMIRGCVSHAGLEERPRIQARLVGPHVLRGDALGHQIVGEIQHRWRLAPKAAAGNENENP
jgi:hypothetical protein